MRIVSFEIEGLHGRNKLVSQRLNSDLNILTGRNGAGKTSVLKILWSIVSGNIYIGLNEVVFQRAQVVTDLYSCTVHRLSRNFCKVEFIDSDGDVRDEDDDIIFNAEDLANNKLREYGRSIFFPTFRRIEGGFSIATGRRPIGTPIRSSRSGGDLEESLVDLSRKLSNSSHAFVSAISTVDIVNLLLRKFADLSEEATTVQRNTSSEIINQIRNFRPQGQESQQLVAATDILSDVRKRVEHMEVARQNIMAPLDEVKATVERLFKHIGINIGTRINFGDAAKGVSSDLLSAGEKQMLSFLCYNAFSPDGIMFIDEPELSLHADWQRQLFGVLGRQQSSNQFIVATHSPFIYTKYPDKEVEISNDRGDIEVH